MSPEEIKKLFIKFYDQTINLDGLVLFLDYIEEEKSDTYAFYFKSSNPNDVSYYEGVINEELKELVGDFCEYLNIKDWWAYIIGLPEVLHFGEDLENRIEDVFKKVKYIEFDNSYYSPALNKRVPKLYIIYIDHIRIKEYWDYDSISIYNVVKPTRALLNGEPCNIKNALYAYDEYLQNKETYYETDKYYVEIDSILSDYPLLSVDYIAQYYHTKFI